MTETPAPRKRTPRKAAAKAAAPQPEPANTRGYAQRFFDLKQEAAKDDSLTNEQWREIFDIPQEQLNQQVDPSAWTMYEMSLPGIHKAIWSVMKDVGAVRKTRENTQRGGGYNFRGVDDVVNAVYPAFVKHGVTISPKVLEKSTGTVEVGNNRTQMSWAEVTMEYTLRAADDTSVVWSAPGAAFDAGDKALAKACSVAYRIAMLQGLCLPTDSPDPDEVTYERSNGPQREAQGREQATPLGGPPPTDEAQAEPAPEPPPNNEKERNEMWRVAKALGWEWKALSARFLSDHGVETKAAMPDTLEAFTAIIVREAEEEEDRAKAIAAQELGAKPVDNEPMF